MTEYNYIDTAKSIGRFGQIKAVHAYMNVPCVCIWEMQDFITLPYR